MTESLKWFRVKMWGAGIEGSHTTFCVTHEPDGRWAASMSKEHPLGRKMFPLGYYDTQEQAKQACQDEVDDA